MTDFKYSAITKRNGNEEEFNEIKITNAIFNSYKEVKQKANRGKIKKLCAMVLDEINKKENEKISVDDVQDVVESVLMKNGDTEVAKAYILYRSEHDNERKNRFRYAEKIVKQYIENSDWRVNENANQAYSFPGLINHVSSSVIASYCLNEMYPKYIADAHNDGFFHIHDLGCGVVGYCCGHSLRDLLLRGFIGNNGRASAKPAKHFDTALLQIVNYLNTLQTEFAGAQAFNSFDTLLAPFVRKDKLTYSQVKQNIQQMVFGLNIAARLGQCPFSNLSFDWVVPKDLKDHPIIIAGEYSEEETYRDYQKEMDMINKAFLEIMSNGDSNGTIFSFPIPTYNITKDFNWDSENATLLFQMTAKYGIPYFQNFVNSDLDESDIRSLCCRLQLDKRELRKKTGGLFGGADKTGSIGVVTLNLARYGYLANSESELFNIIEKYLDIAKDSLEIKREYIEKNMKKGLMPYTKIYIQNFDTFFSTIGVLGANEMCMNFIGKDITSQDGIDLSCKVLEFIKKKIADYQEETGHMYNLEGVPAEGTTHRLARIDKQRYKDIIQASDETPYYTNSTMLPVGFTDDIYTALDLQERLQTTYTGGIVFHTYIGEKITTEQCKNMVYQISHDFKIPYFSITPTFSICPEHGYIAGEHWTCPNCK